MKKSVYIHIDEYGDKYYYQDKKMTKLHREDGPAVEYASGTKYWYRNGKCHREDGPAIELCDGDRAWYLNDMRHREDGPAIECSDGYRSWYLNGHEISEAEHTERTAKVVELTLEDIAQLAGVDVSKLKIVERK